MASDLQMDERLNPSFPSHINMGDADALDYTLHNDGINGFTVEGATDDAEGLIAGVDITRVFDEDLVVGDDARVWDGAAQGLLELGLGYGLNLNGYNEVVAEMAENNQPMGEVEASDDNSPAEKGEETAVEQGIDQEDNRQKRGKGKCLRIRLKMSKKGNGKTGCRRKSGRNRPIATESKRRSARLKGMAERRVTENGGSKKKLRIRIPNAKQIRIPNSEGAEEGDVGGKQHDLYRRGIAIGFAKDIETKVRDHYDFKSMVIGDKTEKFVKEHHMKDWKPHWQTQMMVVNQTKTTELSPIEVAIETISCFAAETNRSAWDILRAYCIQLTYDRKNQSFKASFTKGIPRATENVGEHFHQVCTAIDVTIRFLVAFVGDLRKQALEERTEGFGEGRGKNGKGSQFIDANNLRRYCNKKIELFYVGLIIMDYVFEFTDRCKGVSKNDVSKVDSTETRATQLVVFVRDCMRGATNDTDIWRFYDRLLRIFDGKPAVDSEDMKRRQELLEKIRAKPKKAMDYVEEEHRHYDPEEYYDALKLDLGAVYGTTTQKHLFMKYSIKQNEVRMVRWLTLQHIYTIKFVEVEGKKKVLCFYKNPYQAHKEEEIARHKKKGLYEAANKKNYYGKEEALRDKRLKKLLEDDNYSDEEDDDDDEDNYGMGVMNDTDVNDSDDEEDIALSSTRTEESFNHERPIDEVIHTNESNTSNDDKADDNREENNEQVSDTTAGETSNSGKDKKRAAVDDENKEQNATSASLVDNAVAARKRRKVIGVGNFQKAETIVGLVDPKWMEKNPFSLNIHHDNDCNLHIESSNMQCTWSTRLGDSFHGVCKMEKVKKVVDKAFDGGGQSHLVVPGKCSYIGYEDGVVRSTHEYFKEHKKVFDSTEDVRLVNFLLDKGCRDAARDGSGATTFRYDFGFSNQDFQHQQPDKHFRDKPKLNNMLPFQKDKVLGRTMGGYLNSMNTIIDTAQLSKGRPKPLSNEYIHQVFTKRLNHVLECKRNRFQAMTAGVTFISPEKFQATTDKETESLTKPHTDNLNGMRRDNNHSCIFHKFVLIDDPHGTRMVARIFLIAYTRKSLEYFEKNEKKAMPVKKGLNKYKQHVKDSFRERVKCMGQSIEAEKLHEMNLPPPDSYEKLTVTPEEDDDPEFECEYVEIPALHSPELTLSAPITTVRNFMSHSQCDEDKALEVIFLSILQSNYLQFFNAGEFLLKDPNIKWDESLYVQLCKKMKKKFRKTSKTLKHRLRPMSQSFIDTYKDPLKLKEAVKSLKEFLIKLRDASRKEVTLTYYREHVLKLCDKIPGLGQLRMQRVATIAICSRVIVTKNVKFATFGFPSSTGGVSKEAYAKILKECNLGVGKNFQKISRLLCYFAGHKTHRTSWGEYLLCEALGRKEFIVDFIYKGQNLYYIFVGEDGEYVVREKYDGVWCDVK